MFVAILVVIVVAAAFLYKDYKTIVKLTKEIGELSADIEILEIDLEGEKMFRDIYQSFLNNCHLRELNLQEELETLQNKNVKSKSKKVAKKENKKNTKTAE